MLDPSPIEALVIGAGPAGGMAALRLARGGLAVHLVEQHRFPRDKVCGECLSALAWDVLGRAGLHEAMRSAGAVRLDRFALHADGGRSLVHPLPRPMWGLSRGALDSLLLEAAREAGAVVHQPARCEAVERVDEHGKMSHAFRRSPPPYPPPEYRERGKGAPPQPDQGGWLVRLRDLSTNQVATQAVRRLILADGKSALADAPPPPTGDFGIKSHWVDVKGPRDTIELFSTRGRYGGLAAIEGGRWNAAFSVSAKSLREAGGDVGGVFDGLIAGNPTLTKRLAGARRVGDWLAAPLPRFRIRPYTAGLVRVGNAAGAIEPIGGEGMGLALRSAELAAEAILGAGEVDLDAAFRRLWRSRRIACRASALLACSPFFGPLLRVAGPVVPIVLEMLGKAEVSAEPQAEASFGR